MPWNHDFFVSLQTNREKMTHHNILLFFTTILALSACSSGGNDETEQVNPPQKQFSIQISPIADSNDTFEKGDKAGLFVGNQISNQVSNLLFTFDGNTWTPATKAYWKDTTTRADLYFYKPYKSSATDINDMSFSVATDQSTLTSFRNSNLILGQALNIAPTANAVKISTHHALSLVKIKVVPGKEMSASDITVENFTVKINGTKPNAAVNLANGNVSPTGDIAAITPYYNRGENCYEAVVVPQTVGNGNIITVTTADNEYNLLGAPTFKGGETYNCTVTIDRAGSSLDVSISQWDTDDKDYGGTAQ